MPKYGFRFSVSSPTLHTPTLCRLKAWFSPDFGRFSMPDRFAESPSQLRSAGIGARINAAGMMIFELDAVRRLNAARGWTFSFNLRPGF
jgi:hypothetical protein